jgi:hypothetical protein
MKNVSFLRLCHGGHFRRPSPPAQVTSARDLCTVAKPRHRSTLLLLEPFQEDAPIRRHLRSKIEPKTVFSFAVRRPCRDLDFRHSPPMPQCTFLDHSTSSRILVPASYSTRRDSRLDLARFAMGTTLKSVQKRVYRKSLVSIFSFNCQNSVNRGAHLILSEACWYSKPKP